MTDDSKLTDALTPPTEREKWGHEIELKEKDFMLREREYLLKETELELKKQEHAIAGWKSPLVVAIMAGSIAVLGNALLTMTNGKLQRDLEDQKSEQTRILEMIKTGDPDKAAENLKFLLDAGLISKAETIEKLGTFLKKRKPGSGPTLPSATGFSGTSLTERINAIKKRTSGPSISPNGDYKVDNHILLDNLGNPVSVVESPSKGQALNGTKAIVLHYSGSASGENMLKWLADKQARISTHLVIDRDGKVTQLVPFDIAAWHAGRSAWKGLSGLNNYSIGIDFVNAGQLIRDGDQWVSPLTRRKYSTAEVYVQKNAASGEITGWHKYTDQQIQAAKRVIRALSSAYPTIDDVLSHSEITSGRKLDPGPAFPIEEMREVFKEIRSKTSPTN